jgi:hypothetical protein
MVRPSYTLVVPSVRTSSDYEVSFESPMHGEFLQAHCLKLAAEYKQEPEIIYTARNPYVPVKLSDMVRTSIDISFQNLREDIRNRIYNQGKIEALCLRPWTDFIGRPGLVELEWKRAQKQLDEVEPGFKFIKGGQQHGSFKPLVTEPSEWYGKYYSPGL